MSKKVFFSLSKFFAFAFIIILSISFLSQSAVAQSNPSSGNNSLDQLRSDVGIHGLTVNVHGLSDATYLGNDTLSFDGSSELEFVYRDVRMMSQRLGVGFQILTSFFQDAPESNFGVGSWGIGPIIRAYPFRTDRFQPYVQFNVLAGKNFAVGELANTTDTFDGFRMRLGLRAGTALRITNRLGVFGEVGYDWGSGAFFKADARALQANFGIDYYLFN